MKNTFGNSVSITIFGESHGAAVGAVLDGFAPGVKIDKDFIEHQMNLRKGDADLSTPRREADEVEIMSGVFNGRTTGTPICFVIKNKAFKSSDYEKSAGNLRPGHADFTARKKYNGYEDYRGGGHFSGRLTAAITVAGAVAISALKSKNILIGTHISECAGVKDICFTDYISEIARLSDISFPVLSTEKGEKMKRKILAAKQEGDSVGGILETAVTGFPAGVGEPFFDSVESVLSHALFSIPGLKGVEFGKGFDLAGMKGSEANDPFAVRDGKVITLSNNNGGINGGISNGMPIVFRTAIKPTPSIYKKQHTVNINDLSECEINISGRHDPAIIHRARVVQDSVTALAICDLLALKYGTDFLGE